MIRIALTAVLAVTLAAGCGPTDEKKAPTTPAPPAANQFDKAKQPLKNRKPGPGAS